MKKHLIWISYLLFSLLIMGCDECFDYLNEDKFEVDSIDSYQNEIIELKNQNLAHSNLILTAFSDIHGDVENAKRLLNFCNYYSSYIDDVISLGDNVLNDYSNDFVWWNKIKQSKKVLNSIGNHDTADYSSGSYDWTKYAGSLAYDKYFASNIVNWSVNYSSSKTFYYKEYLDYGIVLVVLDPMCYDKEQELFLSNTLNLAINNGLSVICVSHYPVDDLLPLDCGFTLSKFVDSNIVNKEWSHDSGILSSANVIQDFIDTGGSFICWLSGHLHKDAIGTLKKYPNQLVFVFEAATCNNRQVEGSDSTREKGTNSQDSFNLLSLDILNKKVSVLRIGNQSDIYNRSKRFITIDYSTKQVIDLY